MVLAGPFLVPCIGEFVCGILVFLKISSLQYERLIIRVTACFLSVASEGPGLTHEDKRVYLGTIEQRSTKGNENSDEELPTQDSIKCLYVEGSVMFGSDLGMDARPEPVGSFTMREVQQFTDTEGVGKDEEGDDDENDDDDTTLYPSESEFA